MIKLLKFSSNGHDVMQLEFSEAVSEASRFEENYKGRIVDTKTNSIISSKDIKDESELLLLSQLQGG